MRDVTRQNLIASALHEALERALDRVVQDFEAGEGERERDQIRQNLCQLLITAPCPTTRIVEDMTSRAMLAAVLHEQLNPDRR